ncbi:MAG: hypothetical protein O7A03_01355 [Alphaproteobacteria bacterium]|nr:hypothetical protein [Alphaproteobacteria bacterium]
MNRQELIAAAKARAAERVTDAMDLDEKFELLELAMVELLDIQVMTPPIGRVTSWSAGMPAQAPGRWLMGDDPRLPKMPEKPTLIDFFQLRLRLSAGDHLLQSANLAMKNGLPENIVLACLLHDIAVVGLIRSDHGHWGAQLIAPYVDEEVAWAVRHHQALKFRADPAIGYEYPQNYLDWFGEDYEPKPYIKAEWEYCRNHKWYMSAMQICMNDLYAFDPDTMVDIETFTDIIGRHFKQPAEGLGFDASPVAHMWRTMIWPNNYL